MENQTLKIIGLATSLLSSQVLAQDNITLSSALKSSNDRITGTIIGNEPSFRNSIKLNKGNLTGIIWGDYNLNNKKLTEYDLIGCYNSKIGEKTNTSVCFENYNYSNSEDENYVSGNISYDFENINLNLHSKHFFGNKSNGSGQVVKGSLSKKINLINGSIIPSIGLVYTSNFFGNNGITVGDVSIDGAYNLTENLSLNGSIKKQFAIDGTFEDKLIGEVGVCYKF
jgi:hypothetical protein